MILTATTRCGDDDVVSQVHCAGVTGEPLPLLAPAVTVTTGTLDGCAACEVFDSAFVVDLDSDNFAIISLSVAVAGSAFLQLDDTGTVHPAGTIVGFVVEDPPDILAADLLNSVTVATFLDDEAREETGEDTPLDIELLGAVGGFDRLFLSFQTSQSFNQVRLDFADTVGLLSTLNVFGACTAEV